MSARLTKSGLKRLWRAAAGIARGILAELSDQSAYQRHLAAHGVSHSAQAWRQFQDEQWQERARRPRCC
jgi:hypothetical protein